MRNLVVVLFAVLATAGSHATDKGWTEVRSPHFRVLTNHTEKEGRSVALGLEQIRSVFTDSLPGMRVDSDVETLVLAARDDQTLRQLVPSAFHGSESRGIAGMYIKGNEKDYAIVELDYWRPQEIIYHEYVHKLLHLNFTRLPRWLDEGLAEFFANSGMRDGKAVLGFASPRLELLRRYGIEPVDKIVAYDYLTERTWDGYKIAMFYAESWALTHYLMLGEGMKATDNVTKYLMSIQNGSPQKETFTKLFGDPKELTNALRVYIDQKNMPAAIIATPAWVQDSQLSASKLTGAQMSTELAGFFMRQRRYAEARDKLEDSLKENNDNWLAHETLGFVSFGEGKLSDAYKEWDIALKLNPKAVLSLYYRNLLALRTKKDRDSVAQLKEAMDQVLAIDPQMAVARVQRSRLFAMQGDLESGLAEAKRVLKFEPDLAGYFLNYGELELLNKNYAGAIRVGKWVAQRWYGSDRAEALELVERARRMGGITPTEAEKTEEATLMEWIKDTVATKGTVEAVSCKNTEYSLDVRSGEHKYTFRGAAAHGGSDTLGITGEHFDPCHHATGLRVVVRSKIAPVEGSVNTMQHFEFRNDLLPGEVE